MDLGTLLLAILQGRATGVVGENTDEIGGCVKAETLGNVGNRQRCVTQQPLGFLNTTALDVSLGALTESRLHKAVKVVGRDAELVGVEIHAIFREEMFFHKIPETGDAVRPRQGKIFVY